MASQSPRTELIPPSSSTHTRLDERSARLFVAAGPDKGKTLQVTDAPVLVGSDPECDLVLRDTTVSRRHLEVRRTGVDARIRDLGSTNGTFHGDARISEIVVAFGGEVRLGRTVLRFLPTESVVNVTPSPEESFGALWGRDVKMREIFSLIAEVARTEVTVLIEGETGTGKELVARAIHENSPRASGPFVVFDCSAIPKDLMESSLFGHMRGAFTGATDARVGAFEAADGGTLFLDEVGELDLTLQPKLLRVLESREVKPVGGDRYRPVDVRVVAATNRVLKDEVRGGGFRADLYYRLLVVKLVLPPLRKRPQDVGLLAERFLTELGADAGTHARMLHPGTLQALVGHPWRGNVRELRNVISSFFHLGRSTEPPDVRPFLADFELEDDDDEETGGFTVPRPPSQPSGVQFKEAKASMVEAFEKEYIQEVLGRHGGNISGAAREAGIDRKHFRALMSKYGLD